MTSPPSPPDPLSGALSGVRVLTLAPNLPGPWSCARLTAMGAAVTKVEPPTGDLVALVAPDLYRELTAGQTVVTLDLRTPAGRDELAALVADTDLLVTSMRPSAADRLGLAELVEAHCVAHVEIVGDVDDPDLPGHDLTYQARCGTLTPPTMPRVLVADALGAERACIAALAALRMRDQGKPVRVRVALEEGAQAAAATVRHGLTTPGGVLGGGLPGYNIYATSDGHIALAALEPHFAAALSEHIGSTADELTTAFAARTSDEWETFAAAHDIPLAAIR